MELEDFKKAEKIISEQSDVREIIDHLKKAGTGSVLSLDINGYAALHIRTEGEINFINRHGSDTAVKLPGKTASLVTDFLDNLKVAMEIKRSDLETEFKNL